MNLREGTVLQGGKYRIERVLGSGGFGITYLAIQMGLNRRVAIKEFFMSEYCNRDAETMHVSVPSEGSKELVARFRVKFVKEAQNIADLKHPHIISLYDVFEENGTAYYVMEYLDHGSLADLVKRHGHLSESDALRYTRQIADALRYIHARKMNHLDVKPGNILINETDHAVLIDFGLSKRYDGEGNQTSTTPVGVSHGYAPMEQYKRNGVGIFSPATDIYSLGATLYKLVTGATPPDANDVSEDGLPPFPPYVSPTVAATIKHAMQLRRKDRPQTVDAFLALLNDEIKIENERTALEVDSPVSSSISIIAKEDETSKQIQRTVLSETKEQTVSNNVKQSGGSMTFPGAFSFSFKKVLIPILVCVVVTVAFFGLYAYKNQRVEDAHLPEEGNQTAIKQHCLDTIAKVEERKLLAEETVLLEQLRKDSIAKDEDARYITYDVNGVNFTMIKVDGGTYTMGTGEAAHQVKLSDFCIGVTEVTQELWKAVMGLNPSEHTYNMQNPVENVSWNDCQNFVCKLYELTGVVFRLPTDAEWEYAARGGNKSLGYKYSGSDNIDDVAWYFKNSSKKSHPVKSKQPNELGLYDMNGNVQEWCNDKFGPLPSTPQINPTGTAKGVDHVLRGGGLYTHAKYCDVYYRNSVLGEKYDDIGFRLVVPLDSLEIVSSIARLERKKAEALAEQRKNERMLSYYTGIFNGHKYVDLGLSVKWATCNVDASSPSGTGGYYAWAETETKTFYDYKNYKYCTVVTDEDGRDVIHNRYVTSKYSDISGTEYDVAHVKWGSTWRMPMDNEWKELEDLCQWVWTTYNGINGYRVTGPNGNSIFLPAAGVMISEKLCNFGKKGEYWSGVGVSSYGVISRNYYKDAIFSAGPANTGHGCSVRPVTE